MIYRYTFYFHTSFLSNQGILDVSTPFLNPSPLAVHLGFASKVGDTLLQALAKTVKLLFICEKNLKKRDGCTAKSPTFESKGTFDAFNKNQQLKGARCLLCIGCCFRQCIQISCLSCRLVLLNFIACFKHSDLPTTSAPNTGGSSSFSHTR